MHPALLTFCIDPDPEDHSKVYKDWNSKLAHSVTTFYQSHSDITAAIYSSYNTFARVLDDPASYGFIPDHVDKEGGQIWKDHLHPTSAMHDVIAKDISSLLRDIPSSSSGLAEKRGWVSYLSPRNYI